MNRNVPSCLLLIAAPVAVVVLLWAAFDLGQSYSQPVEVRSFLSHREAFTRTAEQVLQGDREPRLADLGEDLASVLRRADVRYVRRAGGCVTFSFPFLPPDPVPMLVYAPAGRRGLPALSVNPAHGKYLVEFRQIDGHWFYVRWDMP